MAGLSEIPAVLLAQLQTLPNCPPIAIENVGFTPPIASPWLRIDWLPAIPQVKTIGPGTSSILLHTGIFQISIFSPSGEGEATNSNPLLDEIVALFKGFSIALSTGRALQVLAAYPSQTQVEDAWYMQPISLRYQILTP
jgi:hypothetical protein